MEVSALASVVDSEINTPQLSGSFCIDSIDLYITQTGNSLNTPPINID